MSCLILVRKEVLNVTDVLSFLLDALAACNYLPQSREKIIAALFKALNSTNNELQEAGEACMRKVSAASLILFLLLCHWFGFG